MMLQVVSLMALLCVTIAAPPPNVLQMEQWREPRAMNLVELATSLGAKTLVKLVADAGLASTLAGPGPFTVFGPTDDAFAKLPKAVLDKLMKDKDLLKNVLLYHVVSGDVYSSQLKNEMLAPSLFTGKDIRINIYKDGKVITATGSPVVLADQNATNGVIHVVNRVLFPIPMGNIVAEAANAPDFSTLVTAVKAAGLVETLSGAGPFTLFAPTNEAFRMLPPGVLDKLLKDKAKLTAVLTYHVVSGTVYSAGLSDGMKAPTVNGADIMVKIMGDNVFINNAKVVMADDAVTNGVIHVINKVLLPPSMHYELMED